MNKDQFARLERHRKVKQRLTEFKAAVDAVPAFADVAATYLGKLQLLDGTAQKKPVSSQGATASNNQASESLITRLVKFANALWLLYKKENKLDEASKLHRRPTDYRLMKDLEFATEAISVSKQAKARLTDLANYNITSTEAETLTTDADNFNKALENPQLAIDAQKIKGTTVRTTLRELNLFLKEDLRSGMELLKDTHNEAYKALREATQVDDPAYRKRKAKRMAKRVDNSPADNADSPS